MTWPTASAAARRLRHVQHAAAQTLRAAGKATPELDARLLLTHALGLCHEDIIRQADRELQGPELAALARLLQRRLDGEPVSRILGQREFYGRPFVLSSAVLDPRPDSETLIEAALSLLRPPGQPPLSAAPRILDLGTGSGVLLLTLLAEITSASGIGTDISPAALEVARDNAARLGVEDRASLVRTHWAQGINERFDLIISNPPYIPQADLSTLSDEVRLFDPPQALDGGVDGLEAYRALLPEAARRLRPDGHLIVEIGADQATAVMSLMHEQDALTRHEISIKKDLAARPRCVIASPAAAFAQQL